MDGMVGLVLSLGLFLSRVQEAAHSDGSVMGRNAGQVVGQARRDPQMVGLKTGGECFCQA